MIVEELSTTDYKVLFKIDGSNLGDEIEIVKNNIIKSPRHKQGEKIIIVTCLYMLLVLALSIINTLAHFGVLSNNIVNNSNTLGVSLISTAGILVGVITLITTMNYFDPILKDISRLEKEYSEELAIAILDKSEHYTISLYNTYKKLGKLTFNLNEKNITYNKLTDEGIKPTTIPFIKVDNSESCSNTILVTEGFIYVFGDKFNIEVAIGG